MDIRTKNPALPYCVRKKPYPKVPINMTSINITAENIYPMVKKGGSYRPSDCQPRMRVGIIVPYRNRLHNLGIFLNNIHPFLMAQKLDYQIFVIEQNGVELFNKGRLYNAGFKEMIKFNTFHCAIFHDLDLLPLDENIMYSCPTLPRHMCATVNDTDIKKDHNISYQFKSLFGGVVAMTIEQYQRANGFSNLYFGWGGEDNDMFWRLRASGYPVVRYQPSVGVYYVMPHLREPANPFRHHLLSGAVERYKDDGLSNLEYSVLFTNFYHLCTHIVVDINPRNDSVTELNLKWGKTYHKLFTF
uniref:Beta-1,4-N-acetylgalactosaminyltransferase n=1 Tax=Heliothis virescens TaxID=7102 RepID=A0A2A4JHQ7_HELVI